MNATAIVGPTFALQAEAHTSADTVNTSRLDWMQGMRVESDLRRLNMENFGGLGRIAGMA